MEQIVKNLAAAGEDRKIKAIVDKITADYAFSPQANYRKVRCVRRRARATRCMYVCHNDQRDCNAAELAAPRHGVLLLHRADLVVVLAKSRSLLPPTALRADGNATTTR